MSDVKKKIIRSNRRTLSMQVLPGNTLIIKAPLFVLDGEINKFIQKNKDWIDRKLKSLQEVSSSKKRYQEGEEFLFLGKVVKLSIGNYKEIKVVQNQLQFPNFMIFRIEKELSSWYVSQSKTVIKQQLDLYAKEMKTSYEGLMFSDTRSKWGSCTHDNRLQFSWRLIMAPILTINYVVIHELAHTFEKNHSRSFWNKVRLYNPSFKQQIKWLKQNGSSLVI